MTQTKMEHLITDRFKFLHYGEGVDKDLAFHQAFDEFKDYETVIKICNMFDICESEYREELYRRVLCQLQEKD